MGAAVAAGSLTIGRAPGSLRQPAGSPSCHCIDGRSPEAVTTSWPIVAKIPEAAEGPRLTGDRKDPRFALRMTFTMCPKSHSSALAWIGSHWASEQRSGGVK
uniref:Uncharacterized protein n=1 Tax=Sphaerodactylus townsendi TaxID=933632 RepID=A0ACB8FZE1_9SAUR